MEFDFDALNYLKTYWGFSVVVAVSFYLVANFAGRHFAPDVRENLSLWLLGAYESSWSHQFCKMFDTVFGKQHLSWNCFARSAFASVLAVFGLYFLFSSVLGIMGGRVEGSWSLFQVLLIGAAINIIPDYISLFETRWLLKRFEKTRSILGQLTVLLVDSLFTGTIIWIGILLFQWIRGEEALSVPEMVALFSIYSIFFFSTFLTSIWAWLYCLTTWFMRLFSRSPLKTVLDVEKRPMTMIGLVGAGVILLAALAVSPGLKLVSAGEGQSITRFDQKMCEWFPGSVCDDVSRLTKDEKQKLDLLSKACLGGANRYCIGTAAKLYKIAPEKAVKLWTKSCERGDELGCVNLGVMYENGFGTKQDKIEASRLYLQACEGDNARGCSNLGTLYKNGFGITQSTSKAVRFYQRACEGNSALGCFNLGFMYQTGTGIKQDMAKAMRSYQQACEVDNAMGCYNLGVMYDTGSGVKKDQTIAARLIRKACESGYAEGCTKLGVMYGIGSGVNQDMAIAASLYQIACERDHAAGCAFLGYVHENGLGVNLDLDNAARLYQQACEGGNEFGCNEAERLKK